MGILVAVDELICYVLVFVLLAGLLCLLADLNSMVELGGDGNLPGFSSSSSLSLRLAPSTASII